MLFFFLLSVRIQASCKSGCHLRLAVTCRTTRHGIAMPLPPYFKTASPPFDLPRPFMAEAASKPRQGNLKASVSSLSLPLLLSSSVFLFFFPLSFFPELFLCLFCSDRIQELPTLCRQKQRRRFLGSSSVAQPRYSCSIHQKGSTSQNTINWIVSKTQCWFNDATRLRGHRSQRILSFELMDGSSPSTLS